MALLLLQYGVPAPTLPRSLLGVSGEGCPSAQGWDVTWLHGVPR